MVWGLGMRVEGLGFRVVGFWVEGLGFEVVGFWDEGLGFRIQGGGTGPELQAALCFDSMRVNFESTKVILPSLGPIWDILLI